MGYIYILYIIYIIKLGYSPIPMDLNIISRWTNCYLGLHPHFQTPIYHHGTLFLLMIIHDQCDFLCLTIHVEKESDRQNVSGKNFDTFLNLENYEPLRLPWKIRKKLKSQAAASYLTAMNALQVEKTWCTSLWRKISLRSKQWQQIPRKPWGIQPSTEIVDAPSGWSNLALTMIDFRMVKPCLKNQAVNWDTEAQTPEANYWCFFAIA